MPVAGLLGRRVPIRRLVISLILAVILGLLSLNNAPAARAAGPCGPPVTSVIACENTLPGDPPSDWQVSGAGDSTIQGFATSMSVNAGQTESFKISTPASSYHIDILRIGYYQGNGARKVVSNMLPTASLPQTQPACRNDTAAHRAHRLRQLGRVGLLGGAEHRRVRPVHRASGAQRHRRQQSHPVRRPQRREPLRHPVPDLRRDLAGLQHLRRQQPLHSAQSTARPGTRGLQGRLQGVLQPAVAHGAG